MADPDASLKEEVIRAGKAREVLEHPLFREAILKIESALLDGIRRSAFVDEKLREKLCHRYALLQDLVNELGSVMTTGEMAAIQIEQKKRWKII
jgi:hypothetical protein